MNKVVSLSMMIHLYRCVFVCISHNVYEHDSCFWFYMYVTLTFSLLTIYCHVFITLLLLVITIIYLSHYFTYRQSLTVSVCLGKTQWKPVNIEFLCKWYKSHWEILVQMAFANEHRINTVYEESIFLYEKIYSFWQNIVTVHSEFWFPCPVKRSCAFPMKYTQVHWIANGLKS